MVVICIDCFDEIVLMRINPSLDFLRSANRSLWSFTIPVLVNQFCNRAFLAEKFVTLFAVVSQVLEIKFVFAFWIFAKFGLRGFSNELFCLSLISEIHRSMSSRIWLIDIHT